MDRRQRKTRQAVYDAFAKLLAEKSYSNITVHDIIDEADIGRNTFYSRFETKDAFLKALCPKIFDHVFSEKKAKENTHDFSQGEKEIKAEITHILYHLQDNNKYVKRILYWNDCKYLEQIFTIVPHITAGRHCWIPLNYASEYIL